MASILSLEAISKSFGAVVIADGLDLELAEGEALGMLGPNGAGKTTLFGIITGTIAADSGRLVFDGRDITRLSPVRRSRLGMARTFQMPQPFGRTTVFENLVTAAACVRNTRESDVYHLAGETLAECDLLHKANQKAG